MYGKIFLQIFDSSIAEDYLVRLVFQDLVVLSDSSGAVDMTVAAISRRTNVPREIVEHAISVLSQPDRASRSGAEDGRRIVPLDSHRDWGWHIVNYAHYRGVTDEESRRAYFRDRKRQERERKRAGKPGKKGNVLDSPGQSKVSTQGEGEGKEEGNTSSVPSGTESTEPNEVRSAHQSLPLNDGSDYSISTSQIAHWGELYPAVDVLQECRKMKGWCEANPKKCKTRKGILRFVNNWLSGTQDRGGNGNGNGSTRKPNKSPRPFSGAAERSGEEGADPAAGSDGGPLPTPDDFGRDGRDLEGGNIGARRPAHIGARANGATRSPDPTGAEVLSPSR
jgi:hypothetical protein